MLPRWLLLTLARCVSAFLGVFSVLNVVGNLIAPGFDANMWWIALPWAPWPLHLHQLFFLLAGLGLIAFAFAPKMKTWRRRLTIGVVAALVICALGNTARYYLLYSRGDFHGTLVPISMLVAAVLALILLAVCIGPPARQPRWYWTALIALPTLALIAVAGPLIQMYGFGKTDYRRPADAIVVFGAAARPDGTPSAVLADRVATACELYKQGLAPVLIFSGGPIRLPPNVPPWPTAVLSEPQAMRLYALKLGVPDSAILLDEEGLNTDMTVHNTVALADARNFHRLIAVSHFYHLPRIKQTFHQAGRAVYTVPAVQTHPVPAMTWYLAREVAAQWAYYLRPLVG